MANPAKASDSMATAAQSGSASRIALRSAGKASGPCIGSPIATTRARRPETNRTTCPTITTRR